LRRITMPTEAMKAYEHIGETTGCPDYIHDLVHELNTKLDALWRYDQYIANAEMIPLDFVGSYIKTPCYDEYLAETGFCNHVRAFWRDCKRQCQADIERLKQALADEVRKGNF
jgi:hypothetical protein